MHERVLRACEAAERRVSEASQQFAAIEAAREERTKEMMKEIVDVTVERLRASAPKETPSDPPERSDEDNAIAALRTLAGVMWSVTCWLAPTLKDMVVLAISVTITLATFTWNLVTPLLAPIAASKYSMVAARLSQAVTALPAAGPLEKAAALVAVKALAPAPLEQALSTVLEGPTMPLAAAALEIFMTAALPAGARVCFLMYQLMWSAAQLVPRLSEDLLPDAPRWH